MQQPPNAGAEKPTTVMETAAYREVSTVFNCFYENLREPHAAATLTLAFFQAEALRTRK